MTNEEKLIAELQNRFGNVKTTGNGWIRIPCPTCDEHNRKKCKRYVSTTSRYSNCFICARKMDIQDLLGGHYMPTFDPNEPKKFIEKKVDPRAFELPCHYYHQINQLSEDHPAIKFLHKDYLYDLDLYWNNYNIFYVPFDGGKVFKCTPPYTTSSERLVFPVFFGDKMVGWQMRSLPGTFYGDRADVIRYYHLFDKGSYLFNYNDAKKFDEVVVVEGVKKALKFPNGVATWGSGISNRQLQLIQEWPKITMMLDGEDHNGTQQRAKEFVEKFTLTGKLAINIDLRKYGVPSPDDLPADILQAIVKEEWHEQRGI
ncbi:conserved hypothetical protein [Gammaproteobacteria bacterium]